MSAGVRFLLSQLNETLCTDGEIGNRARILKPIPEQVPSGKWDKTDRALVLILQLFPKMINHLK